MSGPVRLAILGSTGSIGRQTLDVAARFPDRIEVVALAANTSVVQLAEQAGAFGVTRVAIGDAAQAPELRRRLPDAHIGAGAAAVEWLAAECCADIVLNALVGAAGLRASCATLDAGVRLALANKESLVIGGRLITERVQSPDQLIPVDSEHSAIFQCLVGEDPAAVARIWLTASGGPFRGRTAESLARVTVNEALAHPRWTMGPKITIDSATLMNKGLEAIEAHFLFGTPNDHIRVVVHPQSCDHSMVEYRDGSVKAHLGVTDMRTPIQYALSYPARWDAPLPPVDFTTLGSLTFEEPDLRAFPCLTLALAAGREGGTMPTAMNAANEVAVAGFLEGTLSFGDIPRIVEGVMDAHDSFEPSSIEDVEAVDAWARVEASRVR